MRVGLDDPTFRLVALKTESQNGVEVVKPVLQEPEVLRLSAALGALKDMDPKDVVAGLGAVATGALDEALARGLWANVLGGSTATDGDDERTIAVEGLFGKQPEIARILGRRGLWPSDDTPTSAAASWPLHPDDQGIFAILLPPDDPRRNDDPLRRRVVVFGWLRAALFAPARLRGTATYVLRFLTCLSPAITCCLSSEDVEELNAAVEATGDGDSDDWKAYSVAFHVEQQRDQEDSVEARVVETIDLTGLDPTASDFMLVTGTFPAVAATIERPGRKTVENSHKRFESAAEFATWLVQQREQYNVVPKASSWGRDAKDAILKASSKWPQEQLDETEAIFARSAATIDDECREQCQMAADELTAKLRLAADTIFSVDLALNSDAHKEAISCVKNCVDQWQAKSAGNTDQEMAITLRLPQRLQKFMTTFMKLFEAGHCSELSAILEKLVVARMSDVFKEPAVQNITDGWFKRIHNWFQSRHQEIPPGFSAYMCEPLNEMKQLWWLTVERAVAEFCECEWKKLSSEKKNSLRRSCDTDNRGYVDEAFQALMTEWNSGSDLTIRVSAPNNSFLCNVQTERWVAPSKRLALWTLQQNRGFRPQVLGELKHQPGEEIIRIFSVLSASALVVSVGQCKTQIRRVDFSLSCPEGHTQRYTEIKTIGRRSTICAFNEKERKMAFHDSEGAIGLYHFNNNFTLMEIIRTINATVKTSLSVPLASILVVNGALVMADKDGWVQSVDTRSQQTSKKLKMVTDCTSQSRMFAALDGQIIGSIYASRMDDSECGMPHVAVVSAEDHRALPSAPVTGCGSLNIGALSVQGCGSTIFLMDSQFQRLVVVQMKATIRSDSYQIRTSHSANQADVSDANQQQCTCERHWLWIWFHLYEKFPVRGQIRRYMNGRSLDEMYPSLLLVCESSKLLEPHIVALGNAIVERIMDSLSKLAKPLYGMDLTSDLVVSLLGSDKSPDSKESSFSLCLFLQTLATFIPVQICRAESNSLTVLHNGEDQNAACTSGLTGNVRSADIARSLRFGMLSPVLQSWRGDCVVITSMGKQSTGKSYFLNHLTGSSFAIAGERCTDGAWMCVRPIRDDILLIVIDFEGLGSFERTEQEDVFLSVLNAAISHLTIFRMEMRFDKEIDELFSKFQKGCKLIKRDSQLFRGRLYMSVKDVNPNDQVGVLNEFFTKANHLLVVNKQENFLTEMYGGQLEINCSPPLGTPGYHRSLKHAQVLAENEFCGRKGFGFTSGKSFLDCIRLVLAKISILDWTSLDESAMMFKLAEITTKLPGAIRYGAICQQSGSHGSEIPVTALVNMSSGTSIKVQLNDVCEAFPDFASKWRENSEATLFDKLKDDSIDFGQVSAQSDVERNASISSFIERMIRAYCQLTDCDVMSKDTQYAIDEFLAYLVRRRRLRVQQWALSYFGEQVPPEWRDLEQHWFGPLQTMYVRCHSQCCSCQLGCVQASIHPSSSNHDCGTSHRCQRLCQYCQDSGAPGKTPLCVKPAGHDGKCECAVGDHTCKMPCQMIDAANCGRKCSLKVGHEGTMHRCSVDFHKCGRSCSAQCCDGHCAIDFTMPHTAHKCDSVHCVQLCVMDGCDRLCSSVDHFHGQTEIKVAYAVEQVVDEKSATFDDQSEAPVIHMCNGHHDCPGLCEENGICHIDVFLKSSAKTFHGKRVQFEYTYQEMNGSRKKCVYKLGPGQLTHTLKHSCCSTSIVDDEERDDEDRINHYCDARCPSCSYYCQREYGHGGLHKTTHGNMRNTLFLAEGEDIDVCDRKYAAGDRGTAEMCNLFCSKMGRQHVHYLDCDQKSRAKCIHSGTSEEMRRHCVRVLIPSPAAEQDELLHEKYWQTLGWEDPCASQQEREEFGKCGFKCDAPDHDSKKPSHCVLEAWHQPISAPRSGFDGFSYVGGHKFECSHIAAGGKMHHVFVLDCSGSMQGWPWEKLVAAYHEYVLNRINEGASLDVVSIVTFDSTAEIVFEGRNITTMSQVAIRYRGGGTSYGCGLRTANEVLSRINFDTYKPALVFFSDGHPSDPSEGEHLAQHIGQSYEKYGLQSFAVGFGSINLGILERVADKLGGLYFHTLTGCELKSTFHTISASLGTRAGLALTKPVHENDCVICQKELPAEETVVLTPCCHELHERCYRLLVERASSVSCPSCRQPVTN